MEPVITEGAVRTVETVTNRVVTNKTVVQRTANTTSTHVNKYDTEGNLKSSEVDSESWEERDTKNYQWSDPADRPPDSAAADGGPAAPAITGGELSVEKFLASEQSSPSTEGATLVMTTTDFTPGITWSGTVVEQSESGVVAAAAPAADGNIGGSADVQASQRTTTNMAGESWSRSGEAVWITETTKRPPTTPDVAPTATHPPTAAVENKIAVGVLVDAPTATSNAAPAVTSGAPAASISSPTTPATPPSTAVAVEPTSQPSIEERRRKRCQENRARKAAMAVEPTAAGVVQPSTA